MPSSPTGPPQRRVEESLQLLNTGLARAGQHYAEIEMQNTRMFAR